MDYRILFSLNDNGQTRLRLEEARQPKSREFKGSSANRYVSDYCIVDLETTGVFVSSSEIIEISAIKVRNNQVIDEFSTLVNPHCHIPAGATAVNHITDEMVKNAPSLDEVIDSFLLFIQDDVIVGFNNAAFDMNLIYDKAKELRNTPFRNDYLDVFHAARRCIKGLTNYRLETVSKHYGFDTEGEHRALKDCYLTKSCYEKLYEEYGNTAFIQRYCSNVCSCKEPAFAPDTLALKELHSLLEGILKDGKVTVDEVDSLRYWIEEHRDLSGHFPFDKAYSALDDVLEDGKITNEELLDLESVFSEIINPVKSNCCHDAIPFLSGKHVCITGDFVFGSRHDVEKLIECAGGFIDSSVKKSTDYLVVGAKGSTAWKTGNYGGKIQKAMEFISKGSDIKIIEEFDFVPRMEYLIDHPEENSGTSIIEDSSRVALDESNVTIHAMIDYMDRSSADQSNSSFDTSSTGKSLDWKDSLKSMLHSMVVENELPDKSLYLMANYGRDGQNITSYSVCIYEPDYPLDKNANLDPTRNSIVLNIKESKKRLVLLVANNIFEAVGNVPETAEIKKLKSDPDNTHVLLAIDADSIVPYIREITAYELANYESKAPSFGCCSKYIECSDAKHCIHENKLFSKACGYRRNLEAGRIFYGKNMNID